MAKVNMDKKKKKAFDANNSKISPLKFLIVLVKRGHGLATNQLMLDNGCSMTNMMYAEGTRDEYVLNILGGEDKNKEVIFATVNENYYEKVKKALETRFLISSAAKGVLLTFDIKSMAGVLAYKFLSDYEGVNKYGSKRK